MLIIVIILLITTDFIEYMKQWPEMINLLVEDLTTSANWHLGRIFVDEFVVKAPEYLTQFGLVKQFALKSDSQPALAPIVEKLQNAEDILVEPKCMQALHNNLSGYRKVEFLRLTSNILRNLFRKFHLSNLRSVIITFGQKNIRWNLSNFTWWQTLSKSFSITTRVM
jgi:hypothetical protein